MSSRPGTDPADRFQLVDHLASGGMADVFLAVETGAAGFSRLVVLKRLRAHLASDTSMIEMFLREARLVARLDHPNIVKVHELGEISEAWYLSLEYVPGVTLRDLMREATRRGVYLPFDVVAQLVSQACAGAHAAHELPDRDGRPIGLVHRDISPDNLMITAEGHLKLLDFGIAKVLEEGDTTRAGTLKGKVNYMAPEQAQQQAVDRRSDVFSLGVVLWEALTTRRLFRRDTEFASMHAVITGKLLEMDEFRADIPRGFRAVALKALSLSPDDRYPTADAMRRALEDAAFAAGIRPSLDKSAAWAVSMLGPEMDQRARRIRERVERLSQGETLPIAPGGSAPSFSSIDPSRLRPPDPVTSESHPRAPVRSQTSSSFPPTPPPVPVAETAPEPPATSWTPWIIGAAVLLLIGATTVGMVGAGAAAAWMYQDVPSGTPLLVGLPPVMDAGVYLAAHEPARVFLEEALNRPVTFSLTTSYDALGDALIAGSVGYALMPPTLYLKTKGKDDRVVALAIKQVDGVSGSDGVLLTRDELSLAGPAALVGHTVCYTDPSSTSGYILPRATLRLAGINPDLDLGGSLFSGNHLQAMRDLASGRCDAAGTYSAGWMAASRTDSGLAGLRVLAITGRAPQDAWVAGPSISEEEAAAVRDALLSWRPTENAVNAVERITGFGPSDDAAYGPLREALIAEGVLAPPPPPEPPKKQKK